MNYRCMPQQSNNSEVWFRQVNGYNIIWKENSPLIILQNIFLEKNEIERSRYLYYIIYYNIMLSLKCYNIMSYLKKIWQKKTN